MEKKKKWMIFGEQRLLLWEYFFALQLFSYIKE